MEDEDCLASDGGDGEVIAFPFFVSCHNVVCTKDSFII